MNREIILNTFEKMIQLEENHFKYLMSVRCSQRMKNESQQMLEHLRGRKKEYEQYFEDRDKLTFK